MVPTTWRGCFFHSNSIPVEQTILGKCLITWVAGKNPLQGYPPTPPFPGALTDDGLPKSDDNHLFAVLYTPSSLSPPWLGFWERENIFLQPCNLNPRNSSILSLLSHFIHFVPEEGRQNKKVKRREAPSILLASELCTTVFKDSGDHSH